MVTDYFNGPTKIDIVPFLKPIGERWCILTRSFDTRIRNADEGNILKKY